jgi:TRAP-type C4-dicarboxylate transport system substrate-binding protein
MKKACLVLMAVCMGSAFIGLVSLKAQAAPIKLTYNNFFPKHHVQSKLAEAWCKEVEDRTQGKVKIQYVPGGSLAPPPKCYEGVVSGTSDIGQSVFSYTEGRFPVMDAVGLPLGYTSGKVATGVLNKVYRHFKPKELEDTEPMYFHGHGPGFIHTKGKVVKRLEDMKGLKIRSTGNSKLIIEQLAGISVKGTIGEVYGLVQKGAVVGSYHPLESNFGFKLGEVLDHVTAAYSVAYTAPMFVVMNKGKWEALPEDIKNIIREVNNEWIPQHGEAWDTIDMEGMRFFMDHGGQMNGLSSSEASRWKTAITPIINDYVKFLDEKGLDGRGVIDFIIRTLNSMQ